MMKKLILLGLMLNMPFQVCLDMDDDDFIHIELENETPEMRSARLQHQYELGGRRWLGLRTSYLDKWSNIPVDQIPKEKIERLKVNIPEYWATLDNVKELYEQKNLPYHDFYLQLFLKSDSYPDIKDKNLLQIIIEIISQIDEPWARIRTIHLKDALQKMQEPTPQDKNDDMARAIAKSEKEHIKEQAKLLSAGSIKKLRFENPKTKRVVIAQQLALTDADKQAVENITCGPRTLFIANAINELVKQGTDITPQSIENQLASSGYQQAIQECNTTGKQLESTDFGPFMDIHNIKIPILFLLGSQGNDIIPLAKDITEETDFDRLSQTQGRIQLFNKPLMENRLSHPIHFISTDAQSGHWFLISVIPRKGHPEVLYIDPKNVDYTKYPYAQKFMIYIIENLMPEQIEFSRIRGSSSGTP